MLDPNLPYFVNFDTNYEKKGKNTNQRHPTQTHTTTCLAESNAAYVHYSYYMYPSPDQQLHHHYTWHLLLDEPIETCHLLEYTFIDVYNAYS
jgi:hypothetical protein